MTDHLASAAVKATAASAVASLYGNTNLVTELVEALTRNYSPKTPPRLK